MNECISNGWLPGGCVLFYRENAEYTASQKSVYTIYIENSILEVHWLRSFTHIVGFIMMIAGGDDDDSEQWWFLLLTIMMIIGGDEDRAGDYDNYYTIHGMVGTPALNECKL